MIPLPPDSALGEGGCNAMRGRGGQRAGVLEGGLSRVGDTVAALNDIGTQ